jgi:acetyl esterase/lipase
MAAGTQTRPHRRLTPESTIGDLLEHPTFAGFTRLILPWDDRPYDARMRLARIGSLLPYHDEVDPETAVSALNRMIDDAGRGETIYYDVYAEEQRRDEPALADVGLFFFRGRPGAPFAVVSPGGGFRYVGSVHEGFPFASAIAGHGYNAFVLKYRTGMGSEAPTRDLAAAIDYIFDRADQLGVSRRGYSLWGSSAGARMAAAIGSHGVVRFGGANHPRPSAVIMAYTAPSANCSTAFR